MAERQGVRKIGSVAALASPCLLANYRQGLLGMTIHKLMSSQHEQQTKQTRRFILSAAHWGDSKYTCHSYLEHVEGFRMIGWYGLQ